MKDFECNGLELYWVIITKTGKELDRGSCGNVLNLMLLSILSCAATEVQKIINSSTKIMCIHSGKLQHPNIVQLVRIFTTPVQLMSYHG